jgi:hypothetical protein
MPLILRHDRLARGNLHHLVTKRLRLENDDLIDRFHRDEEASMARMIRLTPTTALTSWATSTLRLRRIARWRA